MDSDVKVPRYSVYLSRLEHFLARFGSDWKGRWGVFSKVIGDSIEILGHGLETDPRGKWDGHHHCLHSASCSKWSAAQYLSNQLDFLQTGKISPERGLGGGKRTLTLGATIYALPQCAVCETYSFNATHQLIILPSVFLFSTKLVLLLLFVCLYACIYICYVLYIHTFIVHMLDSLCLRVLMFVCLCVCACVCVCVRVCVCDKHPANGSIRAFKFIAGQKGAEMHRAAFSAKKLGRERFGKYFPT